MVSAKEDVRAQIGTFQITSSDTNPVTCPLCHNIRLLYIGNKVEIDLIEIHFYKQQWLNLCFYSKKDLDVCVFSWYFGCCCLT